MQSADSGWGSGLLGVIIFSGSLPATRVAVGGFSPLFLTSARAVIAALLGAALLGLLRQARPERSDLVSLAIVALGVVVGFPLLTALALQHITSAHSIVFIGLLPLATAIFGVLRGGERPKPLFWLFSFSAARRSPALRCPTAASASLTGDLLMVAADRALRPRLCRRRDAVAPARRLAGHLLGAAAVAAADGAGRDLITGRRHGAASVVRPGSGSPMSRSSACWSASSSGIAASRSAASPASASCSCCSPSSAWRSPASLLHEPVAWTMIAATALVVVCVFFARRFA